MFNESYKKISSLQNPLVKHLVKIRENSDYRNEQGSVLITGRKTIYELVNITIPKRVFFTEGFFCDLYCKEIYEVTDSVLKKITNLPAPESICAEFPLPKESSLIGAKKILTLDQISDPGNLGTLIRTALAFGWDGIFFLPNCVDPFHEKVMRACKGALFRIPWRKGTWEELEILKEKNHLTCLIADLKGKPLTDISQRQNLLLILSNEAQGVSPKGKAFGQKVTIPMIGDMESLNVAIAGAILMYGLGK